MQSFEAGLKASGGNLTQQHVVDVSMCALFLMEAVKKTDKEFDCSRSSAHTTTDAQSDVNKMLKTLVENKVAEEITDRTSPTFQEPTKTGLHKMFNTSWIQEILLKQPAQEVDLDINQEREVYELTDVQ